jgi:hypothetical protein
MSNFNGTITDANAPIIAADRLLSKKIDNINTTGMSIDKAAFEVSRRYVESYKGAIENYITAVSNKHSLIEQGGFYLSEMQRLKAGAESNGDFTNMTSEMVKFLQRHGIKYDRTGGPNDVKQNPKEWQVNIEYLNNWIKGRANNVETDVIKLNDIINKQNQLLQSVTTILKKAHEVLQNLIKSLI